MVAVAADWEVSRSRWPETCLAGGRGPGARARAGGVGNADCAGRPVACAGWRGCGQPRSEPVAPRGRPRIARVRRLRAAARLPGRTGRGYPPGPAPAATEYRKSRPSPREAGVGRPHARESRRAWPACPGGPACAARAQTWPGRRPSADVGAAASERARAAVTGRPGEPVAPDAGWSEGGREGGRSAAATPPRERAGREPVGPLVR